MALAVTLGGMGMMGFGGMGGGQAAGMGGMGGGGMGGYGRHGYGYGWWYGRRWWHGWYGRWNVSDHRLKTDIRWIKKSPTGVNVYQFRYAGGGPLYQGVIAQELVDTHPDAVVTMPGGYYGVLYERIDVDFINLPEPRWIRWY